MSATMSSKERGRIAEWGDQIRASYWFVPLFMALASVALAIFFTSDAAPDFGIKPRGTEGAREVLSATASSVVAVMGVVFSILIVVLSLASSQYGPRVIRNYQRDRVQHYTIGMFIATFLFSILVLRTIRTDASVAGAPLLLAVGMSIASISLFVYFIHHTARTIQAPLIASTVSHELMRTLDQSRGATEAQLASERAAIAACRRTDRPSCELRAARSGYLDAIDIPRLVALTARADAVVEVVCKPGDFVLDREVMATIRWDGRSQLPLTAMRRTFTLGNQRTLVQDVRFAIVQLVEVALHALSPGINEPYTAVTCIHRLGEILDRIAREPPPAACRYDKHRNLRLVLLTVSFPELVAEAFEQLIGFAGRQPYVLRAMLSMLSRLNVGRAEDRQAVAAQVRAISLTAEKHLDGPARSAIVEEAGRVIAGLTGPAPD